MAKEPEEKKEDKKYDALKEAIGQIEKQYGKGSIMRLGADSRVDIPCVSTGILSLDLALGGRGIPRGRVMEIFGPESAGKTTLCLNILASAQKAGGNVAFIDVEHALDPDWAEKLGVSVKDLIISQPDSGEQALNTAEILVRSNAVDVIVLDSVAALAPKSELEGDIGDSHIGLQARLMSQALRKLTASISKTKTSLIFTNQIREKVGIMFGNPEITPGGRALKFYASIRIEVKRMLTIKEADQAVGIRVKSHVVKNKIAPPFKHAEFEILYKTGVSKEGDLIDLATNLSLIEKSGTWLSYKDQKLGQGREKARDFVAQNQALRDELQQEILKFTGVIKETPKQKDI